MSNKINVFNWIKCGLPFNHYLGVDETGEFDHSWETERARRDLGMSLQDSRDRVPKNVRDDLINTHPEAIRHKEEYMVIWHKWHSQQPEVIEWNKRYIEAVIANKQKSFCGLELNKVGMLLQIEHNGVESFYLIGGSNFGSLEWPDDLDEKCIVKQYCNVLEGLI